MAECAILLDVIVGELKLVEGSCLSQRAKDPICPVVGVQISNGPSLYIPFLTPESIKNHMQDITKGHQFLPLEVEESYLNDGKFGFQKGKSCLYSVPLHKSSEIIREEDSQSVFQNLLKSSQNVTIVVLNSLHYPPSCFGKCNVDMIFHNKSEGSVKGKIQLKHHNGSFTGYLTIAIMLKILGENVALHKSKYKHEMALDSNDKTLYECISSQSKQTNDTLTNEVPHQMCTIFNNISLLSQEDLVNHTDEIKHSYELSRYSDELLYDKECHSETSEEIARKISELVKHDKDSPDDLIYPVRGTKASTYGLSQPSPFLFSGQDLENERIWNEKMKKIGGYLHCTGAFDTQNEREGDQCTKNLPEESNGAITEKTLPFFEDGNLFFNDSSDASSMRSLEHLKDPVTDSRQPKLKKIMRYQTLKTPKGWLRSTPVAPCSNYKTNVYPRLTRATLLRRAKWDPQLEYQLKAEVNHQVMLKLQLMDRKFKEELLSVKRRKQLKSIISDKISVGCQVDGYQGNIADDNIKNSHSDFSQQTNILSTVNQYTQAEDEERKDRKLQKYLTYDIDVTKHTQSHPSKYEDDFEDSSISVSDSSYEVKEDIHYKRQKAFHTNDPSAGKLLFVTESDSEKREKNRRATNRLRESKMKVGNKDTQISDSDSSLVKSASKSKHSDTSSVQKEHVNMDKSSSASDTDFISVKNSLTTPECSAADVKNFPDISSDASEVSDASDISRLVFQELLKGKQADLLLRNGSQVKNVIMSDSSVAEEVDSLSKSSAFVSEDCKGKFDLRNSSNLNRKFGETFSIGEVLPPDPGGDYSFGKSQGEVSGDSQIVSVQSAYSESADRPVQNSKLNMASPRTPVKLQEQRKHPLNMTYVVSPRGSEDLDSSISNISARIAALLLPKNIQVASLHTDSVSSYIPSNVSDTLSSLSDME